MTRGGVALSLAIALCAHAARAQSPALDPRAQSVIDPLQHDRLDDAARALAALPARVRTSAWARVFALELRARQLVARETLGVGAAPNWSASARSQLAAVKRELARIARPDTAPVSVARTRALIALVNGDETRTAALEAYLALDPSSETGWYWKALDDLSRRDVAGAAQSLVRHTRVVPGRASDWSDLAALYTQLGDIEHARMAWERAYQLSPEDPSVVVGLAASMLADAQTRDAVGVLQRFVRNGTPPRGVAEALGTALLADNQVDAAVAALQSLTQREPTYAAGWSSLAIALQRKGDLPAAREAAQRAATIDPDDARTRAVLASIPR